VLPAQRPPGPVSFFGPKRPSWGGGGGARMLAAVAVASRRLASTAASAAAPAVVAGVSASATAAAPRRASRRGAGAGVPAGPLCLAMRPPKSVGRAAASTAARVAKVREGLANQDKVVKEYAKMRPTKMSTKGILQYIKKQAWEAEE
jgi:hypothetical protein